MHKIWQVRIDKNMQDARKSNISGFSRGTSSQPYEEKKNKVETQGSSNDGIKELTQLIKQMEINHANQLKEHVSQMNAMQNRLITMERAQSNRPQHRPNDKWPKRPHPQDQRPPNPSNPLTWLITKLFLIVDLVDSFMRNQLAKSFFMLMMKWDLIEKIMNKLICLVMNIILTCMNGWI
jgi:hypothetical protein